MTEEAVLVTGGGGYIGSHCCKALRRAGYLPVAFDNFATGWREAVRFGPVEEGDLADRARLDEVFERWKPVAVMHFAALSQVGESIQHPGRYWRGNVAATLTLVEAAIAAGCLDFVFSSTCATYGEQDGVVLDEDTMQAPINAYGASKRAIEDMLRDFSVSDGLRHTIFRYFNVAGADPDGEIGECHVPETHLIPLVLDAISGRRDAITIFGTDYQTPDGTCIRDYVHVLDLCRAHLLALEHLRDGGESGAFNLGGGEGRSVLQVLQTVERVTGKALPVRHGPRRPGDPARLVADIAKAKRVLNWEPALSDLDTIVEHAWAWEKKRPG